jgi:capsular exopolysaccharide synthesis family protein
MSAKQPHEVLRAVPASEKAGPALEMARPRPERGSSAAPAPAAHLVSLVAPASFEAEQYRILRHMVERRHADDGVSAVAVTSPNGGEGKTTTAINLAGALAQAVEIRVLLVEADLRRPGVVAQLGLSVPGYGLAEAITDGARPLEELCLPVPGFNLWVLPAGHPVMSPYEILRSPRVADLLTAARSRYDYVIVDTPPVIPCPDYRLLEPSIDGVILVVAADRTPRETMDAALDLLDKPKTLGVVFNSESHQPHRDSYYYSSARQTAPSRWPWLRRRQ